MKQGVAQFHIKESDLRKALDELIVQKGEPLKKETARKDTENIAKELLQPLLPLKLPPQIDESIEIQLKKIIDVLKRAREGQTDITYEENERNLNLLKALKGLLGKIKKMNDDLLALPLNDLKDNIAEYIDDRLKGRGEQSSLLAIEDILKNWFLSVKEAIVSHYPLDFSKINKEMTEIFSSLPKDTQEYFKLLHAQHVVSLLNKESFAAINPQDQVAQKEKNKAQILFQIETSQLHYDIIKAGSLAYNSKILDTTVESLFKEFERAQSLGAYEFKSPDSVKELLKIYLGSEEGLLDLLIEREQDEIELAYHQERFKGFNELVNNNFPGNKYNITKVEERKIYEQGYNEHLEAMNKCIEKMKTKRLNEKLGKYIETFLEKETADVHRSIAMQIQEELGVNTQKEIKDIIDQAEKKSQLGWIEWLASDTFYSRCKRALIGATTAGTTGGIAGTIAGLGIFSPVTGAMGSVGGAVIGGIAGYVSQDITSAAADKFADLKDITFAYIYGKQNDVAKEYFADPVMCTGLNLKYAPTERMMHIWGKEGANIIACQYTNLLFDLHMKLLYDPPKDPAEAELLKLQHKHFFRNYQLLRGVEDDIKKLYKQDPARAEKQIAVAQSLDCKQLVKEDFAAMLTLLRKEESENNSNHRKAINALSNTMESLIAIDDKKLMLQLSDTPEIKLLPGGLLPEVTGPLLLENAKEKELTKKDTKTLALVSSPQEGLALVEINPNSVQQQKMLTEVKQNTIVVANAKKKKEDIDIKYKKMQNLAAIVSQEDYTTANIKKIDPAFVENSQKYMPDMPAALAAEHLQNRNYYLFYHWFENIFLIIHKNSNNETRKNAISRKLFGEDGKIRFDGKSIWHLMCEDSVKGKEILSWMFRTQSNFEKFINYFDFDYKVNNQNAIVYAASLSGPMNDDILREYIEELFKGYISGTKEQELCDETFKEIVKLKVPDNPIYQVICIKLRDELKLRWDAQYQGTTLWERTTQAISGSGFDSTKVLSQLLAAMAIYCTNYQEIPQSQESLIRFFEFYFKKSGFVDKEIKDLLNDRNVMNKMVDSTIKSVDTQNKLFKFGLESQDEHIQSTAIELSTTDPVPSPEEQEMLIAILSDKSQGADFNQLIKKKPYDNIIYNSLYYNKKFKDKNLIWLAVEANKPEITGILYNLSSNPSAMNDAGPNHASAFTLAASKEDKSCFSTICNELSKRTSTLWVEQAYLSRVIPNQADGRVAIHYIAENGTFGQLIEYFNTEGLRYTTPDWKRLTTRESPAQPYQDNKGNLPLHLLITRQDANDIIFNLNKFIEDGKVKGANSIFDLFEIESLLIKNSNDKSSLSLIMENKVLEDILFNSFIKQVEKFPTNTQNIENLFKCAKLALNNKMDNLFVNLVETIVRVHKSNAGGYIYSNPVTKKISDLINACIEVYLNPNVNIEYKHFVQGYLPDLLKLADPNELKGIMDKILISSKTPENQTLMEMILYCEPIDKLKLKVAEKEKYISFCEEASIEVFKMKLQGDIDEKGVVRVEPVVYSPKKQELPLQPKEKVEPSDKKPKNPKQ